MKVKLNIENHDRPGEVMELVLDLDKIQRTKKTPFWKTGSNKANIEVTMELLDKES